jgi:hypothetical protein
MDTWSKEKVDLYLQSLCAFRCLILAKNRLCSVSLSTDLADHKSEGSVQARCIHHKGRMGRLNSSRFNR